MLIVFVFENHNWKDDFVHIEETNEVFFFKLLSLRFENGWERLLKKIQGSSHMADAYSGGLNR